MTLTQTAIVVKQAIVISAVALVLGLVSFIGYKIWYAYYLAHLPPVEEKPDTKFGVLPLLNFPESAVSTSNYSYSLDTATGGLPKVGVDPGFEKIVKVYFVTQTFATLLAPDRSRALAEKFGISTPTEILSETKYRFKNNDKNLTVDLDNGNFSYNRVTTVSAKITQDDETQLTSGFKQVLSTLGGLRDDLKNARTKVIFLRNSGGQLIPTQLKAEAQAAQISLWPAAIDKKEIFTADFNKALVNATVLGEANQLENYISLNFTYFPIDNTTFATYPLKTAEVAFEDLKKGK